MFPCNAFAKYFAPNQQHFTKWDFFRGIYRSLANI